MIPSIRRSCKNSVTPANKSISLVRNSNADANAAARGTDGVPKWKRSVMSAGFFAIRTPIPTGAPILCPDPHMKFMPLSRKLIFCFPIAAVQSENVKSYPEKALFKSYISPVSLLVWICTKPRLSFRRSLYTLRSVMLVTATCSTFVTWTFLHDSVIVVIAILQASVAEETKNTCSGSHPKHRATVSLEDSSIFLASCPKECREFGFPHIVADTALKATFAH